MTQTFRLSFIFPIFLSPKPANVSELTYRGPLGIFRRSLRKDIWFYIMALILYTQTYTSTSPTTYRLTKNSISCINPSWLQEVPDNRVRTRHVNAGVTSRLVPGHCVSLGGVSLEHHASPTVCVSRPEVCSFQHFNTCWFQRKNPYGRNEWVFAKSAKINARRKPRQTVW